MVTAPVEAEDTRRAYFSNAPRVAFGGVERRVEGVDVVAVVGRDFLRVPTVSSVARADVLGEREIGRTGERHFVIVVQNDQLAELEVAGERGSFRRDAFHQVAVARDAIGVVVDDFLFAIVRRGELSFRDRESDRIADALAERPRGHFHAGGMVELRVARRLTAQLPEAFEVVQRDRVAAQIEEGVDEHRAVARAQNEAIAIEPGRILGIELQVPAPKRVSHARRAERQARMAGVRFLDAIYGEKTNGIDAL